MATDLLQRAIRASEASEGHRLAPRSSLLLGELATIFPGDDFRVAPCGPSLCAVVQRVRSGGGRTVGSVAWLTAAEDAVDAGMLDAARRVRIDLESELAIVAVTVADEQTDLLPYSCGGRVLVLDQRHAVPVAAALREIVIDRQGLSAAFDRLLLRADLLGSLLSADLLQSRVKESLGVLTSTQPRVRRRSKKMPSRGPRGSERRALRILQGLSRDLSRLRAGLCDALDEFHQFGEEGQ